MYLDLPSECFKHPQAEAEACRVQRIFYEREGKRDDADSMFVRERKALRRSNVLEAREELREAKDLKSKIVAAGTLLKTYASSAIEYALADFTCKYGTDWKRPVILWVALVIFVFPFIYCLTHSISGIHGAGVDSIWNCLYFSVVTATTLGYGDLHPVGWGKAIASAEAIFGMFMWAVFLAVFSRKYMR